MKSFKEFIAEVEHYTGEYGKWGIMDVDGVHMDGQKSFVSSHPDLAVSHRVDNEVLPGCTEYAQDLSGDHLNIRTFSKEGLHAAIKHFASFPHMRSGMVSHDHYNKHWSNNGQVVSSHIGKAYEVLAHMTKLAGRKK